MAKEKDILCVNDRYYVRKRIFEEALFMAIEQMSGFDEVEKYDEVAEDAWSKLMLVITTSVNKDIILRKVREELESRSHAINVIDTLDQYNIGLNWDLEVGPSRRVVYPRR